MLRNMYTLSPSEPLLVSSDVAQVINLAMARGQSLGEALRSFEVGDRNREPLPQERGPVMVIPVLGFLGHRDSWFTTYQNVVDAARSGVEDDSVGTIILDIHSPGGVSTGAFEAGEELYELAQEKEIIAVVNEHAFSGAYLLASACTMVVAPAVAQVGSIGVVMTHLDVSEAEKSMGMKITHLYAGSHKIDGTPHEPLSQQARREFERGIEASYDDFTGAVSRYRGISEQAVRATEARIYRGDAAIEVGLVDRVMSVRDLISEVVAEYDGLLLDEDGGEEMSVIDRLKGKGGDQRATTQRGGTAEVTPQGGQAGHEQTPAHEQTPGGQGQVTTQGQTGHEQTPAHPAAETATREPELDLDKVRTEGEQTAVTRFKQINELCTLAGKAELAGSFFEKGLSVDQVRENLFNQMAQEDEDTHVDGTVSTRGAQTTADDQREMDEFIQAGLSGYQKHFGAE